MASSMSIAEIIQAGDEAFDQISAARSLAQKSWDNWRNYDTFRLPTGQVQSRISAPTVYVPKPGQHEEGVVPVMIHQQTDAEHPEHKRLREIAESADREVLKLERAIFLAQQVTSR